MVIFQGDLESVGRVLCKQRPRGYNGEVEVEAAKWTRTSSQLVSDLFLVSSWAGVPLEPQHPTFQALTSATSACGQYQLPHTTLFYCSVAHFCFCSLASTITQSSAFAPNLLKIPAPFNHGRSQDHHSTVLRRALHNRNPPFTTCIY